jgi:hypothetical protein
LPCDRRVNTQRLIPTSPSETFRPARRGLLFYRPNEGSIARVLQEERGDIFDLQGISPSILPQKVLVELTNMPLQVLEPILQKSTTSRPRFLPTSSRRGQTEFFREYDDFYIPTDCFGINLFHSSLAISTARGVEVLTLDKKQTWSVPILKSDIPDVQTRLSSIQSMIKDSKPLGMFRLGESEFLVAFEECAVYINKNGDVSRSVVMYFSGRAKNACLAGKYLVLFNDDFVEVRNAMDGRLKQVIAGKDVRCLDDGGGGSGAATTAVGLGGGMNGLGLAGVAGGPRTVKIAMQHPEYERCQIVLELVENEGLKE